ncbi:MAG TPA: PIN domain-containing protein [Vicinamibacterales bacterium]|nr:PIN domain-containing protein [Vicinamibacterales bacterium]
MVTVALDTNVLAYAENTNGAAMRDAAANLLERLPVEQTLIPVQALGELFAVLVRKARRSRTHARQAVLHWGDTFPLIDTSPDVILMALDLTITHQFGWWDAVIMAAAGGAGCRLLLSEDLQDRFTWNGVTVANPFAKNRHPILAALLQQ